jgi:hypothetical protein
MEFFAIREKEKIITIVKYMISEGMEVAVEIQGTDERFATRAIAIEEFLEGDRLVVEKLYPEEGNSLIQSAPDLVFSFDIKGRTASFAAKYVGLYDEHSSYGLIIEFPTAVQLEEKRKEQRITDGMTEILSAEFSLEGDDKQYQLSVVNIGSSGIGFIVEKKNFDLFEKVNVEDQIRDITCFLPLATMTIDATVKHMTLIKEGQYRGFYLVGIESDSLMEIEALQEELERAK